MVLLFDIFHLPEDVFEVIFATDQQVLVAKLLIDEIKSQGGEIGKTEMSLFANNLHSGVVVEKPVKVGPVIKKEKVKVSYNKRQFYDRILTPLKSMGLVDYDMYKKKYMLSDKFGKALSNIGLMWRQELEKRVA
ncbi:hypothetical protein ACFLZ7_00635 [Nanoarchaeota archaeon]